MLGKTGTGEDTQYWIPVSEDQFNEAAASYKKVKRLFIGLADDEDDQDEEETRPFKKPKVSEKESEKESKKKSEISTPRRPKTKTTFPPTKKKS